MSLLFYAVIAVWDDTARAWSIDAPDFPEIASHAEVEDEVGAQAVDAVATAVEARRADGTELPTPTREYLELTAGWDRPTRNILLLVPVDPSPPAAFPDLRLDASLLERIDAEASRTGTTRSAFLAESVEERLRQG